MVKGSPVSKTFESYKQADKWQNQVRALRDQGKTVTTGFITVQQMFDAYLEYAEEQGRSTGTIDTAKSRFYQHILPGYGPYLNMTTVSKEEHRTFLRMLLKKGIAPSTRNRVRTLIRTMYSVAINDELFGGVFLTNPFDGIKAVHEVQKAIHYWNQEQTDQFLEANQNSHYYPLFLFLLRTGLRIGEALGVHAEQIDKKMQLLTVDRQFDSAKNEIVYRTKGKRTRHIYLINEVMEAIFPLLTNIGPIFKSEEGTMLTSDHFRKAIFPRACKKADLTVINPHATRHSFAANYLMRGGDLWDLSKILGHTSTVLTEQRYAHFNLQHVRNRMEVIERKENVIRANFG